MGSLNFFLFFLHFIFVSSSQDFAQGGKPNIIFILADDLGWNDVSFHGMSQIPTPNIDALAYSGLSLQNYYVSAICTPSRSALMTGRHPIHTGMQHTVLFGGEPRGLPLTEKLLPQYLKELGYVTRIVGKWHLGSWKKEYTPTYRGFDSHLGYWTGHQDYYDHSAAEKGTWGLDMRRNMDVAYDIHGKYSTDVFTEEAVRLIEQHKTSHSSSPLFLYVAHAAVHSGNDYSPLPGPDQVAAKFQNITDYNRRKFAAMLTKLDESVGKIVQSLQHNSMLENSIIIFSSDNGGAAAGFNLNAASNWPLRGVKNTLWEGGVRAAGLIWSPRIVKRNRVASQLMHITDWLPTLYTAAGGNAANLGNIDGINLWSTLTEDSKSVRNEILHNIDDIYGNAALTVGDWKIVKGTTYNGDWDGWYGPSGRTEKYDFDSVSQSNAGRSLSAIGFGVDKKKMEELRNQTEIICLPKETNELISCNALKSPCLFNIKNDPCEYNNLAERYPYILQELDEKLTEYNKTAVPPGNRELDPRGDPKYWNYVWTNFGDYETNLIV